MFRFNEKSCGCYEYLDKRIHYDTVYVYCQEHIPKIEPMEYDYDNPNHILSEPVDYFDLVPTPKVFYKTVNKFSVKDNITINI